MPNQVKRAEGAGRPKQVSVWIAYTNKKLQKHSVLL